jgi:DNA-binding XRE family transcriptional regulator
MVSTKKVDSGYQGSYIADSQVRGGGMGTYLSRDMSYAMTPPQCRAARAWLGWTQADLGRRSQVGLSAIKDFESGSRRTLPSIRLQLQAAFDRVGVIFLLNGLEVEEGDRDQAALPHRPQSQISSTKE